MARPLIALLTDFGTTDPFVGIMKAVVLARCPDAAIVDLTHAVPPQAVGEGAFLLERSFRWFPGGAVLVAVVDPGVGTTRRAVVAEAHGRTLVGPDNGLLYPVVAADPSARAYAIDVARLGLPVPSRTFHGRDVFAPVAAELASGRLRPPDVGPRVDALVPGGFPPSIQAGGVTQGEVVTVDHFGNLITNVTAHPSLLGATVELGSSSLPLVGTYGEASPGALVALINAFDVVEIAQRDGNAERFTGLGRGTKVLVRAARS